MAWIDQHQPEIEAARQGDIGNAVMPERTILKTLLQALDAIAAELTVIRARTVNADVDKAAMRAMDYVSHAREDLDLLASVVLENRRNLRRIVNHDQE